MVTTTEPLTQGEEMKQSFPCCICGAEMGWDVPSGVCSQACLVRGQSIGGEFECLETAEDAKQEPIQDRIAKVVAEYPEWSLAERKRLPEITQEIIAHCRNGNGNRFIQEWCNRVLVPALSS